MKRQCRKFLVKLKDSFSVTPKIEKRKDIMKNSNLKYKTMNRRKSSIDRVHREVTKEP